MSFLQSLQANKSDDEYDADYSNYTTNSAVDRLKANHDESFYSGIDNIYEFKMNLNRSNQFEYRYFCNVCNGKIINENSVLQHCSTNVHLFSHMKTLFPAEYFRITTENNLDQQIKGIRNFLKFRDAKFALKANIQESNEILAEREFLRRLEEIKLSKIPVEIENYRELRDKDERNEALKHDTLLSNIKKSRSPPAGFLGSFVNSNDSDLSSDNEVLPSTSKQESFNSEFNNIKKEPRSNKRKMNDGQSSDIDTDSIENEPDFSELVRKTRKKALKAIEKKQCSEKFLNLLAEYLDNLDFDDELLYKIYLLEKNATDYTENEDCIKNEHIDQD